MTYREKAAKVLAELDNYESMTRRELDSRFTAYMAFRMAAQDEDLNRLQGLALEIETAEQVLKQKRKEELGSTEASSPMEMS